MKITVLAGIIRESDVREVLVSDGIVILETMRPEAERIHAEMLDILDIGMDPKERNFLHNFSTQTSDGSWIHYLITSGLMSSEDPQVWDNLVEDAANQWNAAGSPNQFVASVANI